MSALPTLDQLAEFTARGECYVWAEAVQARFDLEPDAGFYMRPRAGAADHAWSIAACGTIIDTTARQFGRSAPLIVAPDHPHYARYVSWTRHESEAQAAAHGHGWHEGTDANPGVCPLC